MNENEEKIIKYWKENEIYETVKEANKGRKPFYFLDGPPYATGELHPGQIWVKARKDLFLRYKRLRGYDVHDRAGYDVHGLPIEHKIEENLKILDKKEIETKIGTDNFVRYCREYADSLMQKMTSDYERFGIWMDFKNAYIPYRNEYIERAWTIFKRVSDKGLLYRDKKPMLYCPKCETVLAQGTLEVEYKDEEDPAVLVAFEIDRRASRARIEIKEDTSLLIWTTTPWTLIANMSVAVNPEEKYVVANVEGKRYILASARLDSVVAAIGKSAIVEAEFLGSELEGIKYINPLEFKVRKQVEMRKYHKVLFSKTLVSMSEGSGMVHIAPGHGFEDFILGKENGITAFSPIDQHARYTEEAGEYAGLSVPEEANNSVMRDLEETGQLLDSGKIRHSYPHCWRCGSKLVYLSTDQWFLKVSKVKRKLLSVNSRIKWHPKEAQAWQEDVLKNSPDWCISRQRYWDIPIPIWICSKCGNYTVVGSVEELRKRAEDKKEVSQLHRPQIDEVTLKCEQCGGEMHRVKDVFDVWFDSGIAFVASLSKSEFSRLFPADFIMEGVDQLRGWFSTLLKSGVMAYGKAPFTEISVDGMLLAEDGREMHKHLGNYTPLNEMLKITSADGFRLWSIRHTHWLDLPFNKAEISDSKRFVILLYNISNLIKEYSSAIGYTPERIKKPRLKADTDIEDAWIISRLNSVLKEATAEMENYDDYKAVNAMAKFVLDDFSRFYLRLAKKKILYRNKSTAKSTIDLVNYVFYNMLIALSPIVPFAAEDNYLSTFKYKRSIFLEKWPRFDESKVNKPLESDFEIGLAATSAIFNSREKAGMRLRWPLSKATVEVTSDEAYNSLQKLANVIEDLANVKKLELLKVSGTKKEVRPVYARVGPEFKGNAKQVAEALSRVDADELEKAIEEGGSYGLHTESGVFDVGPEHFAIVEKALKEDAVVFKYGIAYVDTEMGEELKEEALMRELERRIQMLRKELGLKKVDKIMISIRTTGELEKAINKNRRTLLRNIGAEALKEEIGGAALSKEFDIEGESVGVKVKKA